MSSQKPTVCTCEKPRDGGSHYYHCPLSEGSVCELCKGTGANSPNTMCPRCYGYGVLETEPKKYTELMKAIDYENHMLETAMAYPTETPQFYTAMEKNRENIQELYRELDTLIKPETQRDSRQYEKEQRLKFFGSTPETQPGTHEHTYDHRACTTCGELDIQIAQPDTAIEEILSTFDTWCLCDCDECQKSFNYKQAVSAIREMITQAQIAELEKVLLTSGNQDAQDIDYFEDYVSNRISELERNNQ